MNVLKFLNAHKTKIVGAILAAVGAMQANSATVQSLISPHHFALFTIGAGVLVGVLGFINSNSAP